MCIYDEYEAPSSGLLDLRSVLLTSHGIWTNLATCIQQKYYPPVFTHRQRLYRLVSQIPRTAAIISPASILLGPEAPVALLPPSLSETPNLGYFRELLASTPRHRSHLKAGPLVLLAVNHRCLPVCVARHTSARARDSVKWNLYLSNVNKSIRCTA